MSERTENLLLHPRTKTQLTPIFSQKPPAVLLIGPAGSGKLTLAQHLAVSLLNLQGSLELSNHPGFMHLQTQQEKSEIPIEEIRNLIKNLRLKPTGTNQIKRVVLVEDAMALSPEAQNALLKILEEAPDATVFILTAVSERSLLPTVVSRTQLVRVSPVGLAQSKDYFAGRSIAPAIVESSWHLSGGNPGLLSALLDSSKGHPLKESVDEFKNFLKASTYERLLLLETLAKDKQQLELLLDGGRRVLAALQHSSVSKNAKSQSEKMLENRRLITRLQKQLAANASPRLIVLELTLNLRA